MNAKSWNSSTANPSRPARLCNKSRSASIGSTIAVDDIASPAPSTAAPAHGTPAPCASAASTAPLTTTCAEPSPNTARRITQSRRGRSSSPIRNSSMTTPSDAISAIWSTSVTSRRPDGPIATPASR